MRHIHSLGPTKSLGGTTKVATLLNHLSQKTNLRILNEIESRNPELAQQIRGSMFTFEDLLLIEDRQMPIVMKEMDPQVWPLALKTATPALKEFIYRSMSSKRAEQVKEDLEAMPPVKITEVEHAQQRIVDRVRHLEKEGKIYISRQEDSTII